MSDHPSKPLDNPALAVSLVLVAMVFISVNDLMIKRLSGGYPLHQIVMFRSLIGIGLVLILVRWEGGFALLRTRSPLLHLLRCTLLVASNMTFFTALAVLPLADATALFYVGPLLITLFSIPLLGEKVGPWRLGAVVIGFIGMIIMLRPWESGAEMAYSRFTLLLPVIAATAYALNQILTRKLGATTKASAMAFYTQVIFILVSALFWLIAGDGHYTEGLENQSAVFLLRAWVWPQGQDIWLFAALGVSSVVVAFCLTQAYRLADAAVIAPFEYAALPLALWWSWLIWDYLPGPKVAIGIALIMGSGMFVFLRERYRQRRRVGKGLSRSS